MYIILILCFFIIGTIFGSFYNVVGYRIPKGESILYPSSHCPNCGHNLTALELIPILSFIFLGRKCKNCKTNISWFYAIFEFLTGILFALSFIIFGFSFECLFSIIFVSMLVIIIISDYQTMIIPDSVLIVCLLLLIFVKLYISGVESVGISLVNGLGAFIFMLLLKLFGDFLFKKDCMGGGDIKLLGIFGFVLGFPNSIIVVFFSAFIALPVSLIILKIKKTHEIPYGPFLAIAAIIMFFLQIDYNMLINVFI